MYLIIKFHFYFFFFYWMLCHLYLKSSLDWVFPRDYDLLVFLIHEVHTSSPLEPVSPFCPAGPAGPGIPCNKRLYCGYHHTSVDYLGQMGFAAKGHAVHVKTIITLSKVITASLYLRRKRQGALDSGVVNQAKNPQKWHILPHRMAVNKTLF